ncbi:MAG: toll/interleukin-1 receptor domain-containing protein [Deltaproteobacteria bacterium]|nr:toll/interleukin-1 receptor domain-containing protein [Deltaproteobacteria bacterium]
MSATDGFDRRQHAADEMVSASVALVDSMHTAMPTPGGDLRSLELEPLATAVARAKRAEDAHAFYLDEPAGSALRTLVADAFMVSLRLKTLREAGPAHLPRIEHKLEVAISRSGELKDRVVGGCRRLVGTGAPGQEASRVAEHEHHSDPPPFLIQQRRFTVAQWLALPRWKVATEAIPLLLGEDPDPNDSKLWSSRDAMMPKLSPWYERRPDARVQLDLLSRYIEDNLLAIDEEIGSNVVNLSYVKARYIEPVAIVRWWQQQGFPLPPELEHEAGQAGLLGTQSDDAGRGASLEPPSNEGEPSTKIKVFMSYCAEDQAFAENIRALLRNALHLRADAIRCFGADGSRLPGGVEIDRQLRKEILGAPSFIGVISRSSLGSVYVVMELGARWGSGRTLHPVLAPGTPQSVLSGPLRRLASQRGDRRTELLQLIEELSTELGIEAEPAAAYEAAISAIVDVTE